MEHETNLNPLVRETILRRNLIENGDHIIVGLSGGPDSVCLFHILLGLSAELEFTLSAVHVNHGLRPGAADEDQHYVENLCAKYGAPLAVHNINITALAAELGETPEEAGRTARYEIFAEEAARVEAELRSSAEQTRKINSVRIAVAHNRNDQIETALMRIIRGTGTDGLAGMPYSRWDESGYEIIRPLLDVDRADIEAYCERHNLNPRRDYTNDEPKYFRNKVRLKLLPFLRENFGAHAEGALLRLSANAAEDRDYFGTVVGEAVDEFAEFKGDAIVFPLDILGGTHPAIRHRLIVALFAEIGLKQDIEAVHLKAADALIEKGETGKIADFPSEYFMEISYNNVVLCKKVAAADSVSQPQSEEALNFSANIAHSQVENSSNTNITFSQAEELPGVNTGVTLSQVENSPHVNTGVTLSQVENSLNANSQSQANEVPISDTNITHSQTAEAPHVNINITHAQDNESPNSNTNITFSQTEAAPETDTYITPEQAEETPHAATYITPEQIDIIPEQPVTQNRESHEIRDYTDEKGRRVLEAYAAEAITHAGHIILEPPHDTAIFNAKALEAANLTPEWRTRRDGDFMRLRGMTGTKKLQDIFVDKKIPRAERDNIMLFAAGSEVLWAPGIRISRMFIFA
jgi:tRNA(Ile)-lysidine synthase